MRGGTELKMKTKKEKSAFEKILDIICIAVMSINILTSVISIINNEKTRRESEADYASF